MIKITAFVCFVAAALGFLASVGLGFDRTQVVVAMVLAAGSALAWNTCSRAEKYLGSVALLAIGLFASAVWGDPPDKIYVVDTLGQIFCALRYYGVELPTMALMSGLASSLAFHQPLVDRRRVIRQRAQLGDVAVLSINLKPTKSRYLRHPRVPAA